MKINPVAIQAYEQLNQNEKMSRSNAETQAVQKENSKVSISPQSELTKSKLSVKAPVGSYEEFLSPQERQALDLLFNKYRDNGRFGTAFNNRSDVEAESKTVGNFVDIKV